VKKEAEATPEPTFTGRPEASTFTGVPSGNSFAGLAAKLLAVPKEEADEVHRAHNT
jgi:hypothetical protein